MDVPAGIINLFSVKVQEEDNQYDSIKSRGYDV